MKNINDIHGWSEISIFRSGRKSCQAKLESLELVAKGDWVELYRHNENNTYWRLDSYDKFTTRFLVYIKDKEKWQEFDSTSLEKRILFNSRNGNSGEICRLMGCAEASINESAFCLEHTYERGARV